MTPDSKQQFFDQPGCYQIRIVGHLKAKLSFIHGDMAASLNQTEDQQLVTTLTGQVRDQAALLGMLNALYDMGCPLLAVERLSSLPAAKDASQGEAT